MQSDDGSDFGSEVPGLPIRGVITELEIHAVKEGVIARMRPDEKFAQLDAIERRPAAFGDAIDRQIEALLEPGGYSERKLGNAVVRTIRDNCARKRRLFDPARRKVLMPHQVDDARFDNLGVVHLNLVRLRKAHRSEEHTS